MLRIALPLAVAGVALMAPASVSAHAELVSTSPADGQDLDTAPTEVAIVFDGELDPDGSEFVVNDAGGGQVGEGGVDLDVAERNEMRGAVTITEPGTYTVAWTAVAADGHTESGEFTFSFQADVAAAIAAASAAAAAAGDAPNTATSQPTGTGLALTLGGLALLVAAGALTLRRAVRAKRRAH